MMTAPWPLRGVTDKMIVVHGRCILPLFKSRSKALTFAPRRFFQTARQSLPFVITLQNVPIPRSRHDAVARAKARFCPAFMMLLTNSGLVEIDVVNSQPLLLAAVTIQWFKNKRTSFSLVEEPVDLVADFEEFLRTYYSSSQNNVSNKTHNVLVLHHPHPSSLYDEENARHRSELPIDARQYVQLCESGELYDQIGKGIERKKAKVTFFRTIFGKRIPKEWSERFPSIATAALFAKKDSYKHLAHLLQRTESQIIIHGVAAELANQGRFVATIHDSVIVEQQDVKRAARLLTKEFAVWGVRPALRVKKIKETLDLDSRV